MDEATEFLTTLETTAPDAATACAGWSAHELVAHLAAGAAEMAELTEAAVAGHPERATREFVDREAPFVALDDDVLRERLVLEALRLDAAVEDLRAAGPRASVPFAGRRLEPSELSMHGRSEAALHRWDLAGDDAVSVELLSQPALTAHGVLVVSSMLDGSRESIDRRVRAAGIRRTRLTFGSPGRPDVVLVFDPDGARLELAEACAAPTASSDPATRLLALWGRRSASGTIAWNGDGPDCRDLSALLWGDAG